MMLPRGELNFGSSVLVDDFPPVFPQYFPKHSVVLRLLLSWEKPASTSSTRDRYMGHAGSPSRSQNVNYAVIFFPGRN